MANPTTNYSFAMPTNTDLVKDLPADFEIFGQAVDTQMKTNADAAIAKTIVDAKGDLIVATAADTVARLAVGGTNGHVLQVDSSTASGLKWDAPAAGGMTSIASGSLSGSTLDITSIPATYNQLFLEVIDAYTSLDGYGTYVRITGETANYKGVYLQNYGGSVTTGAANTTNLSTDLAKGTKNTDNNNYFCLTFPNYKSSVRKVIYGYGAYIDSGNTYDVAQNTVSINYTSAISSLTILCEPGGAGATFSGGTYTLWGIK
jgi:hypothetical protein